MFYIQKIRTAVGLWAEREGSAPIQEDWEVVVGCCLFKVIA